MNNIKRLFQLGSIYSVGALFEYALAFFLIPLYTAYLGTYDYGIVGLMSVTVGLITRFIVPPITSGFVRHYYSPEYQNKQGLLLFNSFLFLSIQSLILSIPFYFLSGMISTVVLENRELIYIVKIYTLILFFQPLSDFLLTFLRQEEKAKTFVFISWTRFLLSAGFIIFGLIYLKLGVLALIYGSLVGILFNVLCIFPIFCKYSDFKISPSTLIEPLKFGYPRILSGFSLYLIQAGDRYVLKIFSTLSYVGLYSFGYTFAGIINFLLVTPMKEALHPMSFKMEKDPESQRNFLRRSCTYFYFLGMFFCLLLSLFAREAIQIMSQKEEFWESWIIVPVIAFSYLQHGLGNILDWGLMMTKKNFLISMNVAMAAAVNIGLNFVFIPFWGILGAAFATLISYVFWNVLKTYCSARFYDLHFDLKRLFHITIIGVGLYLLSLVIASGDNIWINLSIKSLIVLTYFPLFFLTGFFSIKEKKYIKSFFVRIKDEGIFDTLKRLMTKPV